MRRQAAGARIDYVFAIVRQGREPARVLQAGTVLDKPAQEGIFASDHFGVGATVELPAAGETLDAWMAGAVSLT